MNPVVQAQRIPDSWDDQDAWPPGAFWFVEGLKDGVNPHNLPVNDESFGPEHHTIAGIAFVCPGGCGSTGFCYVENPERIVDKVPRWTWNGDREKPTLNPSILATKPPGCGWHGYLTDGVFTPTSDSCCPGAAR